MKRWLIAAVGLFGLMVGDGAAQLDSLRQEWQKMHASKKPSLDALNEAKLGLMIHWGLFSVPAGEWEGKRYPGFPKWIMRSAFISRDEYAVLAGKFNPKKFNADEWVQIAKSAGMRYIIFSAKHHDGFAMYNSEVSHFNVFAAAPFKQDAVAKLHAACIRQGIRFGIYYSHSIDWYDGGDGGYTLAGRKGRPWPVNIHDPSSRTFPEYIEEKAKPQIRELLINYPNLWAVWYDLPFHMSRQLSFDFYKLTYDLQPEALCNHRIGNDFGDYIDPGNNRIPEQELPAFNKPWEAVGTLNNSWAYKHFDDDWKSVEELLFWILDIASKGGSYLLSVGPTSEGLIPEESVKRLREIGEWMNAHGEMIYGTTSWNTFREGPTRVVMQNTRLRAQRGFKAHFTPWDIWYTAKENIIYAAALAVPKGRQAMLISLAQGADGAPDKISEIRLLGTNEALKWERNDYGLLVTLPDELPSKYGYALAVIPAD